MRREREERDSEEGENRTWEGRIDTGGDKRDEMKRK